MALRFPLAGSPCPSCLVLPSGLHQHISRTVCSTELLVMASGTLFKVRILRSICSCFLWDKDRKVLFCYYFWGKGETGYKSQQVTKNIQDWNPSLPTANLGLLPIHPWIL